MTRSAKLLAPAAADEGQGGRDNRVTEVAGKQIEGDALRQNETLRARSRCPCPDRFGGIFGTPGCWPRHRAGVRAIRAEDEPGQFCSSCANQAAKPEHFARVIFGPAQRERTG